MLKILLIDDNPDDRLLVKRSLTLEFKEIDFIEVRDEKEFLNVLKTEPFDFVITDYQLNWSNGLRVLKTVRSDRPDAPVIMFTGTGSEEIAVEAMKNGLDDYILKTPKHAKKLPLAVRSVLEKKEAEKEKKRLYDTLFTVFDHFPEGIFLLDKEYRIVLTNPVADEYLKIIENKKKGDILTTIYGKPVKQYFISPPNIIWHEISLEGNPSRIFELGGRNIVSDGECHGTVFIIRDVTEEKRMAERLMSQERLAAIGQLAAGIAHDFNNILTGIIGYAEILSFDEKLPYHIKRKIDIILSSGQRAAELIKQILDFSRKSITEKTVFDLIPFLKEFVKFISRTLPENIQIDLSTDLKKCIIKADPTKIQQVFANLIVNSKDAMPDGGKITINVKETLFIDSTPFSQMSTGKWVEITVTDTGTGIPKDVLPHIFEPFFTTKGIGKGTGLGLSQAYGIIKQHEGFMEVKTEEGKYTQFLIYLPTYQGEEVISEKHSALSLSMGKGERVLVVEDDESVRTLTINLLTELNYQAEAVENGQEALSILQNRKDEFDLIITDLVMPGLSGIELCNRIKEITPDTPVMAISGYHLIEEDKETLLEHFDACLQKPFSIKDIADILSELIKKRKK
ncbi:MAG: response regulator [Nitrospirae bacterium]|nr:response regulator [Nitrospirota bacterium]